MFGGFIGKKAPKPAELAAQTAAALQTLASASSSGSKAAEKAAEEVSKSLAMMKSILYGDPSSGESNQDQVEQLVGELLAHNVIPLLVSELAKLEFEAKKDVAQIFNNLLRKTVAPGRNSTVEYICQHTDILTNLIAGYDNSDIALTCGLMLRECIRHEQLSRSVLESDLFYRFFEYVEVANFDVASDALASFKELLTLHKQLSATFLNDNYDRIFTLYTGLLNSTNYVTRRQSLKLLGELLLDRANFSIMTRYISSSANLKLMMNLLRDKSKNIQFEAFHVFKVFVANPNKPKPIFDILFKNKDRLISFLNNFQNDKEDETFKEEKAFLIRQIQQLNPEA